MGEITKPMRDLLDIIRFTEGLSAKIADVSDEGALYSILDTEFKGSSYGSSILLLTSDGSKLRFALISLPGKGVEIAEKIAKEMAGLNIKDYRLDLKESKFFSQVVLEGKTVQAPSAEIAEALLPQRLTLVRTLISKVLISSKTAIMTPLYRRGDVVGLFWMSSAELAEEFTPSVKSLARHIESAIERVEGLAERKRAEEALRESEERHRTLFETMAQGAVYQDAEGRIVSANPAAERLLGLSVGQMQGKTYVDPRWKAIHEDGSGFPGETRPSMVALRTGKEVRNVVMGVFNPQTERYSWINITAVPQFRPEDTKPFRVYTTFEDITERRDMERQLRENAERLEELVEERTKELRETERLATIGQTALMVGHDLRNPLQALMNSLYLFKEFLDKAPPEIGELARRRGLEMASNAEEQIVYMNKIISDLTYYASPGHVEPVEAELPKIIKESLELTTIPTSVVVSVEAHRDLPKPKIDVAMIRRVFANLITNAVQAMPNGGLLTIRASRAGESVLVSFSDTGVGIAKEDMGKLFKPFFTTKAQGVGLGLPVCKRLVEAHDGEITIESEEGRKTTVTVKIPLKTPSTAP
jgi:PAS domain S-box-containing protein